MLQNHRHWKTQVRRTGTKHERFDLIVKRFQWLRNQSSLNHYMQYTITRETLLAERQPWGVWADCPQWSLSSILENHILLYYIGNDCEYKGLTLFLIWTEKGSVMDPNSPVHATNDTTEYTSTTTQVPSSFEGPFGMSHDSIALTGCALALLFAFGLLWLSGRRTKS